MLGLNGGLNITSVTPIVCKRRKSDWFAARDRVSVAAVGLEPGPRRPACPGNGDKDMGDSTCCSEGAVIWRGRQDRHVKQLVNKITARLTVLYPDIIKYMLYNTIRDKSEAHRTNYTGQRVSKREPESAGIVTEYSRGQGTCGQLRVGAPLPGSLS